MLQLRNRYHIEKRRIENVQEGSPKRVVESKWPLYEHLSFLSNHIPVRRSFRNMHCRRRYGEFAVKNEHGTDAETETEQVEDQQNEYVPNIKTGTIQVRSFGHLIPSETANNSPSINNSLQVPPLPRLTRLPRKMLPSRHVQSVYQKPPSQPEPQPPYGSAKFLAFGRFLTSSLIELPENQALELVNKFTSDLVGSYLNSNDKTTSPENVDLHVVSNGDGARVQDELI